MHLRSFLFESSNSLCPFSWEFLKDYLGLEVWLEFRMLAGKVQGPDLNHHYCQNPKMIIFI
jgi:hypothetical protein